MKISLILRYHNEELYLPTVMEALIHQDFPAGQLEIIAIDNCSTDNSRDIVAPYANKLLNIDDYRPGRALNQAISQSRGNAIAVLSAHAIPSNRNWLKSLHSHLEVPRVAGAYGAQLYPIKSKFLDKRDLDIFSTLEPRIERKDSDFWNANSIFPRSQWELQPFDETTLELEDHYWTKNILPLGYEVHFEPAALVYHYGHINRIDRAHRLASELSEHELIVIKVKELESESDWPTLMTAALVLNGLTDSPHIKLAIHALGKRLLTHEDFDVRWRMAQVLGKIPDEASVAYLIKALFDSSFYPRDEAAWALARLSPLSSKQLLNSLREFPPDVVPFAALALGRSGVTAAEVQAINMLFEEMTSLEATRQLHAIYFSGEIVEAHSSERLIPELNRILDSDDPRLVAVSCWALGCFSSKAHELVDWGKIEALATDHQEPLTKFEAVVSLGKLALVEPKNQLLKLLASFLSDKESRVRYGAMQSLRLLAEEHPENALAAAPRDFHDEDFGVMFELGLINKIRNCTRIE